MENKETSDSKLGKGGKEFTLYFESKPYNLEILNTYTDKEIVPDFKKVFGKKEFQIKSTDPIISYDRTINYYKSHKQSYIDNICNLLKKDINILEEGQYQVELKITLIEKFNEPNK